MIQSARLQSASLAANFTSQVLLSVCLPLSVVVLHDLIGRQWLRVRGAGIAAECRAAIGQSLEFVAEAFAGRHGGEARTCTAGRLPPWPPACHRPRQRRAAHRSSIAMHRSSSLPPLVSSTVSMSLQDPSSGWRYCVFSFFVSRCCKGYLQVLPKPRSAASRPVQCSAVLPHDRWICVNTGLRGDLA